MDFFDIHNLSDNIFGYDKYMDLYDDKYDEMLIREQKKYYREQFEKQHNIKRDKRGRLNKGALLAKKDNCESVGILLRYFSGMSVKEIVECLGCSKSTVYNVIKLYKESAILENGNLDK